MKKILNIKKHLRVIIILTFCLNVSFYSWADDTVISDDSDTADTTESAYDFSIYDKFKYGDAMNWGDCSKFKVTPGIDICPGYPPYPSLSLNYSYWEPLAMVEVVPDAWKSFLYKESFYDFTSMSKEPFSSGGVGSGYKGTKQSASGKEHIGQHKYESHVWAVSDWWRLKSSSFKDGCFSLTCKTKSLFGCLSLLQSSFKIAKSMSNTIKSINSNQKGEGGKGQGVRTGEDGDKVTYEDGSVYEREPVDPDNPEKERKFEETRPPGNYGGGVLSGDDAAGALDMESVAGAAKAMEHLNTAVDFIQDPVGTVAGKAMGVVGDAVGGVVGAVGDYVGDAASNVASKVKGAFSPETNADSGNTEGASPDVTVESGPDNSELPASTMESDSQVTEPSAATSDDLGENTTSSQAGNQVANQNLGFNNQGTQKASSAAKSKISGMVGQAGDAFNQIGDAFSKALAIADMITFFSPIEMVIRLIADKIPIMLHPIFMTERHQKASNTGGFIMAPIFQQFANMGAGMIMPLFCLTKTTGMAISGTAGLAGVTIPTDFLGKLSNFINGRCVGSWGPLEPRVNILGTGDPFVAAGLASVRSLNIAQNLMPTPISNKPFNDLRFNLDWPHQSNCYKFQGLEGLSRGWTSPIAGKLGNVMDAVRSGDISSLTEVLGQGVKDTASDIKKVSGYVFTYWKSRSCRYVISCKSWRGDTGGK
ncbi:MAG: hypothetical protein GY793_08725 [Proteobacteria bacterium]|nr:hypothetical protein [Pseudomonadota bacterium]